MRSVVEIMSLLIGVTFISMLVHNAAGTSQVIGAASSGFGSLLTAASGGGVAGTGLGAFPGLGY